MTPTIYQTAQVVEYGSPTSADETGKTVPTPEDMERELHIHNCGYLMQQAMRQWHETGDFAHRGEADRWRLLMEEAIKGRSQAQINRMERERGLA